MKYTIMQKDNLIHTAILKKLISVYTLLKPAFRFVCNFDNSQIGLI